MSSQLALVEQGAPPARQRLPVFDPVPVLDTARFEQMYRIAKLMAQSSLIPETLCTEKDKNGDMQFLSLDVVTANCFLIVNQAVGWAMDPFAVAQCASVVHGRVCYEGKLIAAVIDQKLGLNLEYEWNEEPGDKLGIRVFGTIPGEARVREMKGTVGEWKTTKSGSPWLKQPRMQLAYRGARDWCRLHKPALILGVYSIDEMEAAIGRQERLMPPVPTYVPEPPRAATVATIAATPEKAKPMPPDPNAPRKLTPPDPNAQRAKSTPPDPNRDAGEPTRAARETDKPEPKEFDFEAFRAALQAAATPEEADAIWTKEIENRDPQLSEDDENEAQEILREESSRFWTAGEA